MAKEVEFTGVIERQIYNSENYKMYAVSIDREKYSDIKLTIYQSVTIGGNLHSLTPGVEYLIKATEKQSNKGYMYNVKNIKKTDLKSANDVYTFLQEILTFEQATELYREYPNIVDLVVSGKADGVVDLKKLHNIGEYRWGVIKDKIVENFALYDLINEFNGVLTLSMCKALYNKYPSIEKIRSEIKNNPYKTFCGLARVGFKTADALLLDMEKEGAIKFDYSLRESKERCMACIMYFLEENETSGNTKMGIVELRKQVMKLTPKAANNFVDCINGNKNIWYSKDTLEIALKSTYETELKISETIKSALNINKPWDIDCKSYQDKGEFPLTDEQLNGIINLCKYQVSILCGFAGSGKSATINTVIKMLKDNNKSYILLAPSAKAAKVMKEYTGVDASTIHRGYNFRPPDEWGFNEEQKLSYDIVIVDETSMCDIFVFLHLLEGIDFNKTKLWLIGDPEQIASVSAGRVLNDLIDSNKVPCVMLQKIFRYTAGGLVKVSTDTRNCKQFLSEKSNKFIFLGEDKDYGFLQCDKESIIKNCAALYKKLLEQKYTVNDIMCITAQNVGDYGTIAINKQLQKIANPNYGSSINIQVGNTTFYVGDYVMQTKNNYHSKIYSENPLDNRGENSETLICNGENGIIKEIGSGYAIIDFDGILIQYYKDSLLSIEHAYCINTHKSQGSSADIVIFMCCSSHQYMLNSNLMYVGYSRAKKKLFNLGDLATINRCIKKKENTIRNTFLLSMLKNQVK